MSFLNKIKLILVVHLKLQLKKQLILSCFIFVLEGISVTFADTYSFINNVNTGNISVDDMMKLKGLKDTWEYILNTIDNELTIDYIKKIHFEICKGQNVSPLGEFRDKGVGITGTSWRPKLPIECDYNEELNNIFY